MKNVSGSLAVESSLFSSTILQFLNLVYISENLSFFTKQIESPFFTSTRGEEKVLNPGRYRVPFLTRWPDKEDKISMLKMATDGQI